ncbi:hypothetical protein POJ06DRAFT_238476 [Lipomyces tetrasporus]|uniref:Uncharacterized protein n=1 Tax=Lipomyces tetrasporus TaxID=54092 RepID=A0AAD7QRN2_9ASCO|nr:uncharacterized protein POJ06DRAFT_238476 [Lipomyces tetrasporus]KAJ8099711.1 hypothetical protein POJ06DRAFT_238476 [Lipomyces tetrasporus]
MNHYSKNALAVGWNSTRTRQWHALKSASRGQNTTKCRSYVTRDRMTNGCSLTIAPKQIERNKETDEISEPQQDGVQQACAHKVDADVYFAPTPGPSRRPSRYDKDDFNLNRSILLTRPEKWFSARRSRTKLSNFPDLPNFSRRMQNNPYVATLVGKSRLCANWRVKLPSNLLQELALFKVDEVASSSASSTARDTMTSESYKSDVDYAYLPLEPESKKDIVGGATYHILKREHVRQSNWRHLKYIRSMAGVAPEKTGWPSDMATLIERRLRRRLEISARNLRLSGVSGFYVDQNKANEEEIVIAELTWISTTAANGNLKDSEFVYNEKRNIPLIRYFVNQLCGFETASVLRECLTDIVRNTGGIGDVVSWPRSIFVVESAATRSFLMYLWRLRLYIGDRVDL